MRSAFGLFLGLLLAACSGQQATQCTPPRPEICTMEYAPACAVMNDGSRKDYSSPCNACADDNVKGFTIGSCDAQ